MHVCVCVASTRKYLFTYGCHILILFILSCCTTNNFTCNSFFAPLQHTDSTAVQCEQQEENEKKSADTHIHIANIIIKINVFESILKRIV